MSNLEKRMDRYDAVINEWLRANKKTVEYLCDKIGTSPTSMWRYRTTIRGFMKMPMDILSTSLRYVNVSNDDLRIILGLPNGIKENHEN